VVDVPPVLLLVLLECAERLDAELSPPADEQLASSRRRLARPAGRASGWQNRLERVDALLHPRLRRDAVQLRAGGDEVVDLGHGADGSGDHAADLACERLECRVAAVADHEVVRRRPQCRTDHRAPVLDEPELVLGVERRIVAQGAGDAEDQVVPRLVGEERPGALQEVARVPCLDDVHAESLDCLGNA
jgi:hypothetical protein